MPAIGNRGKNLEMGELFTLHPTSSSGATAGTNDTAIYMGGERKRFFILLNVTGAATENTDTLDVYVDFSFDDSVYVNGCHFTQVLGNGGAKKYYAVFDTSDPGTSIIDASTDAAAGAVRPAMFGPYMRTRYVIVDGGGAAPSFTFWVIGFAI